MTFAVCQCAKERNTRSEVMLQWKRSFIQRVEANLYRICCEISALHATMRAATSKQLSTSAAIERRRDQKKAEVVMTSHVSKVW